MITLPLKGLRVVDINCLGCNYLEKINAELASQLEFVKKELEYERSTRVQFKLKEPQLEIEDWEPVGGYKSTRQRIAEAERKAREDATEEQQTIQAGQSSSS